MKHKIILFALFLLTTMSANAWKPWPLPMDSADLCNDTIKYGVEISAVASTGKFSPFWLHTNRGGVVSERPFNGIQSAYIGKQATRPNRWFDYDFGIELVGRLDTKGYTGFFQQLYAHTRLYVIDITAGIKPEIYGNQDKDLSSGGFLWSNNAHPMPRITIGIDNYTPFPFTYGYVEVKGAITHGWFADNVEVKNVFLHHKFAGIRVGGKLPVNINYEFHHVAQWGGISPKHGELGSTFGDWVNAFLVRSGGVMRNDQANAYGNHIGSQCVGIDVKIKDWTIAAYWQNLFEDGPIKPMWSTMNRYDGVVGLSIKQKRWPFISGVLYELIQTTDQSGPWHDRDGYCYGGSDNYFNNSVYTSGWSYFGRTIGTPLITSPIYDGSNHTENNRVKAHHVGIMGDIFGFKYQAMATYAKNFGRYDTNRQSGLLSKNTSLLLEVHKQVPQAWNLDFSISFAADFGTQFGNSFGAMFTVAKRGIVYSWK